MPGAGLEIDIFDLIQDDSLRQTLVDAADAFRKKEEWKYRMLDAFSSVGKDYLFLCEEAIQPLHNAGEVHEQKTLTELLIRYVLDGEVLFPGAFLPYIFPSEELSKNLDQWVVKDALEAISGNPNQKVFINLSAASVSDPQLPSFVEKTLILTGATSDQLVFEVTEHQEFDLNQACQTLGGLAELGCEIALDDFAQGQSGLHQLCLPLDWIKIDGSIMRRIAEPAYQSIALDILSLAGRRGLKIVAEWIETEAQSKIITALAVQADVSLWGQGHLFDPAGEALPHAA